MKKKIIIPLLGLSLIGIILSQIPDKEEQGQREELAETKLPSNNKVENKSPIVTQAVETNETAKESVLLNPEPVENFPEIALSPEERAYILAYHPTVLERKIFKKDPFMKKFKDLSEKKALLSAEDQNDLKSLLKDYKAWQRYQSEFSKKLPDDESYKEPEQHRMMMIDYFALSLKESQNSEREQRVNDLVELVLSENLSQEQPTAIKQSLAGEKVEILKLLANNAPESLAMIKAKLDTAENNNKRLLEYYLDQLI